MIGPMADVTVRLAGIEDADTVGQLLYDFNQEFSTEGPQAAEAGWRFRQLLHRDDIVVSLAETEGRAVGFAYLTLRPTPYYDGSLAQLEELYVAPDLRGQGIGTLLLELFTREVRSRGACEININVDGGDHGARRFYERHGYVNVEAGEIEPMLCYVQVF